MTPGAKSWCFQIAAAALIATAPAPLSAQDLTAAEQAASTERALTPAEHQLRETDCRLPAPEGTITLFDREMATVRLPDMPVLRLVTFGGPYFTDGEQSHIQVFPPLANGGLGHRDNCDPLAIATEDGGAQIAIWIRPTVDLRSDYPSWHDGAQDVNQIASVGGSLFAVAGAPYKDEVTASADLVRLAAVARGNDAIDRKRPLIWTRGAFFIPLQEPEQ